MHCFVREIKLFHKGMDAHTSLYCGDNALQCTIRLAQNTNFNLKAYLDLFAIMESN